MLFRRIAIRIAPALLPAFLLALTPGCPRHRSSGEPDDLPPRRAAADPDQEARELYSVRCAICHGAEGAGDGPTGLVLIPHPRNFHDAAWQSGATDPQIEAIIVRGGAAVGRSGAMPAFPSLASRPAVLAAMRRQIRAYGLPARR